MFLSLLTRVRDDAVGILGIAPRSLARALDDIGEISRQMQRMVEMVSHLPELNQHLASIDAQVAGLQREVAQMRQGVAKINSQVDELNDTLMAELREVTLAVHPLRRTTARFRRTGRAAKPDADSS